MKDLPGSSSTNGRDIKDIKEGSIKKQVMATMAVSLAQFQFGSALAWMSPMAVFLQTESSPSGTPMSANMVFWAASSLCLGGLVMTPIVAYISQRYGRKPASIVGSIPVIISWSMIIVFLNDWTLVVSRILAGMSCGAGVNMSPLYVTEIADDSVRGALASSLLFVNTIGVVVGYLVGGYLDHRVAGSILLLISLVHTVWVLILPETPVFLVKQERIEDAKKCLGYFKNLHPEHMTVTKQIEQLRIADETYNKASKLTFRQLFKDPVNKRSFFIVMAMFTIQLINGGFVVTNYVSVVFDAAFGVGDGEGALSLTVSSTLVGVIMLVGCVISILTVDRFGRKILLGSSFAFCSLSMAGLSAWFYLTERQIISINWLPLMLLGCFVIANIAGSATIPYIIINELFPFEVRSLFSMVVYILGWLLLFFVLFLFNPLTQAIGTYGVMLMFAMFNLIGVFFTAFFIPETKQKSMEQIREKMIAKFKKTDKSTQSVP